MTLLLVGVEGAALLGVDELVPVRVSCQHDLFSLQPNSGIRVRMLVLMALPLLQRSCAGSFLLFSQDH